MEKEVGEKKEIGRKRKHHASPTNERHFFAFTLALMSEVNSWLLCKTKVDALPQLYRERKRELEFCFLLSH